MLKVILHQLHPLMSLDCPLAIRYKKGEYIVIGGDIFGYRLYLGDMICIWFWCIYLMTGCICKGETLCLCFYAYCFCVYVLVSHYGTLILIYIMRLFMVYVFLFYALWNQEVYFGLFVFSTHTFIFLFSVSGNYRLIQLWLLSTFPIDR